MYEKIVKKESNRFYEVKDSMINDAQEELGIIFPDDLKEFYKEIGYGFLESKVDNFNRIMDPYSVCEFRFRSGQFANNTEIEIYTDDERDKLIFFEICEGYFLSIGFTKNNRGKIFDGEKEISESLKQFLIDFQENERFFMDEN